MQLNNLNFSSIVIWCFFHRVFSRILVIPFNRVSPKQDLGQSMRFQTEIKPLIESAFQSIGTILELSAAFATMQSDSIFKEVLALSNDLSDLDMRAQFNYSMLLFSTGKVCQRNHFFLILTEVTQTIVKTLVSFLWRNHLKVQYKIYQQKQV